VRWLSGAEPTASTISTLAGVTARRLTRHPRRLPLRQLHLQLAQHRRLRLRRLLRQPHVSGDVHQHLGRVLLRRRARSSYSIRSGWNIALKGRFQFHKCRQLFICTQNETLSVVAMRVRNPDCSSFTIHRRDRFEGLFTFRRLVWAPFRWCCPGWVFPVSLHLGQFVTSDRDRVAATQTKRSVGRVLNWKESFD
jgi:hypothetical protein